MNCEFINFDIWNMNQNKYFLWNINPLKLVQELKQMAFMKYGSIKNGV